MLKRALSEYKKFLKKFELFYLDSSSVFAYSDIFSYIKTKGLDIILCATKNNSQVTWKMIVTQVFHFCVSRQMMWHNPNKTEGKIWHCKFSREKYRIFFYEIIDSFIGHVLAVFFCIEKWNFAYWYCEKCDSHLKLPFLNSLYEIWSNFMLISSTVHCWEMAIYPLWPRKLRREILLQNTTVLS